MKLTRRQEQFVHNMLDLYREKQDPLHYSEVAEKLGVSRFTAYDMMRLLEEKGMVSSTYKLAEGKSGPGRAEIVYTPTPLAHQRLAKLTGQLQPHDNWETIKERVLQRIRTGTVDNPELAQEMIARIPAGDPSPLQYCTEIMTIIALRIRQHSTRTTLTDYLPHILNPQAPNHHANLTLLSGFALGILAHIPNSDPHWTHELLDHVRHYQTLILNMNPQTSQQLTHTLQQIFAPLTINN